MVVARAPAIVPSGLGARAKMWPLSMWVCASDQARQYHAPVEVERPAAVARSRRSGRRKRGDVAAVHADVARDQPVRVGHAGETVGAQHCRRRARVAQKKGSRGNIGEPARHVRFVYKP
jgi:hypothetical protein